MKTKLLIGVSVCGLMVNAVQAATFTCTFKSGNTVLTTCPIETANPSKTCEAPISNTLQGTCAGFALGKIPLVGCAFHDPKIKAVEAIQILRDQKEGKLTTPAGFIAGGATMAPTIAALSASCVENSGAPQYSAGCAPP